MTLKELPAAQISPPSREGAGGWGVGARLECDTEILHTLSSFRSPRHSSILESRPLYFSTSRSFRPTPTSFRPHSGKPQGKLREKSLSSPAFISTYTSVISTYSSVSFRPTGEILYSHEYSTQLPKISGK